MWKAYARHYLFQTYAAGRFCSLTFIAGSGKGTLGKVVPWFSTVAATSVRFEYQPPRSSASCSVCMDGTGFGGVLLFGLYREPTKTEGE